MILSITYKMFNFLSQWLYYIISYNASIEVFFFIIMTLPDNNKQNPNQKMIIKFVTKFDNEKYQAQ